MCNLHHMTGDTPTRDRMVAVTARLLQRQGLAATGLSEILAVSGAPRGSLYHHFPGGKNQLAAEAIRLSGARVAAAIEAAMSRGPSTAAAIRAFATFYEASLTRSDFQDGCPVAGTALEAGALGATEVADACAAAFASWEAPIVRRLESEGHAPAEASSLATFVVAALEGGLLLAGARREMAPLIAVVERLESLLSPGKATRAG